MAQAALDIDLPVVQKRTGSLLLDVARPIPDDQLQRNGSARWALAGVTWVPWACTNIDTFAVGCEKTNVKNLDDFAAIETQKAFLLADGLRCSTLSGTAEMLDSRLSARLDVMASAAFTYELFNGVNGGPNSFRSADTNILAGGAARTLRLAFTDLETFLAQKLYGARGVIHLTVAAFVLAAADQLVFPSGDGWVTATGHQVVADAGNEGSNPAGTAVSADQDWLYASGPVFYAITETIAVGRRNQESVDMTRNEYQFFAERYGLVAWDPCSVGAVRATLA